MFPSDPRYEFSCLPGKIIIGLMSQPGSEGVQFDAQLLTTQDSIRRSVCTHLDVVGRHFATRAPSINRRRLRTTAAHGATMLRRCAHPIRKPAVILWPELSKHVLLLSHKKISRMRQSEHSKAKCLSVWFWGSLIARVDFSTVRRPHRAESLRLASLY